MENGYTLVGEFGVQNNLTAYFIEPQDQMTWLGVCTSDVTGVNDTKVSARRQQNYNWV